MDREIHEFLSMCSLCPFVANIDCCIKFDTFLWRLPDMVEIDLALKYTLALM